MKIGILGHYGDFNLGDEAAIQAVIQEIYGASSDWTPCCFSINPDDSQNRHQVEAFPVQPIPKSVTQHQRLRASNLDVQEVSDASLETHTQKLGLRMQLKKFPPLVRAVKIVRATGQIVVSSSKELRFLIKSFRILKDIDLLLIAGSNQCFDYVDGPWYFPFNLLKWSVMTRLRGKKLAFVSVGAGPITASLSKYMIRRSLALAHYRSFRDESSKNVIDTIQAGHSDDRVLPDLAFSLQVEKHERPHWSPDCRSKPVVGINPMPLFDERFWPDGDARMYSSLVQKYVDFADWLIDREYPLFFYATHPKDVLVVEDIVKAVRRPDLIDVENCYPETVDQLMARISDADIAVATRFHGILLPYVLGKPVLGIEYWTKTKDLLEYMGQSKFLLSQSEFMHKNEGFELSLMTDRFETLVTNIDEERRVIHDRLSASRSALQTQYGNLWEITQKTPSRDNNI